MNTLLEQVPILSNLSKWNVITALVLAVGAFVLMLCANRLVSKCFPAKTEEQRTAIGMRIKIVCAVVALAACLLAVLF